MRYGVDYHLSLELDDMSFDVGDLSAGAGESHEESGGGDHVEEQDAQLLARLNPEDGKGGLNSQSWPDLALRTCYSPCKPSDPSSCLFHNAPDNKLTYFLFLIASYGLSSVYGEPSVAPSRSGPLWDSLIIQRVACGFPPFRSVHPVPMCDFFYLCNS